MSTAPPRQNGDLKRLIAAVAVEAIVLTLTDFSRLVKVAVTLLVLLLLGVAYREEVRTIVATLLGASKAFGLLLPLLVVAVLGGAVLAPTIFRLRSADFPQEVRRARQLVEQIQAAKSRHELRSWHVIEDGSEQTVWHRDLEVVLVEYETQGDDPLLATYFHSGRRIAADLRDQDDFPFARRYFDAAGCNFATDYFSAEVQQIELRYVKDIKHCDESVEPGPPVFLPPAPPFSYR